MVKLKGLYEIKLVNKDTNEIEYSHKQWNTINDALYREMALYSNTFVEFWNPYKDSNFTGYIVLSDTTPTPGKDYRIIENPDNDFNIIEQSSNSIFSYNSPTRSSYLENNFGPPGSPRTIYIIGIKIRGNDVPVNYSTEYNWVSFVELSTPITQDTNQYLFVRYSLFFNLDMTASINSPNNHYIDYHLERNLECGVLNSFGTPPFTRDSRYPSGGYCYGVLTQFLPPTDKNKLARGLAYYECYGDGNDYHIDLKAISPHYHSYIKNVSSNPGIGSAVALSLYKEFSITDFIGPIGSISHWSFKYPSTGARITPLYLTAEGKFGDTDFNFCGGVSTVSTNTPTISRVYTHPESRIDQIFSDPAYPPDSRGSITLTGTNTTKWPIIGRIRITKTGDASDIVDETISSGDVDTSNDTLLVTQVWGTGDIVQFTGADLPSPLAESTDYYTIYVDDTHIEIASSYQNALDGTEIDLTDTGSGSFDISRQNTGTYQYEIEPYINKEVFAIPQLPMAVDANGKAMPANLYWEESTGEGGSGYTGTGSDYYINGYFFNEIFQQVQIGDYVYTIQKSRVGGYMNICKWPINSSETSEAICQIDSTPFTACSGLVKIGTKLYIAMRDPTNYGIYEWDSASPGVAPSKLTISGIINGTIVDLVYDSVTGKLWSGHNNGLSKIDLGTMTATQYLNTAGGELEGLTDTDVNIDGGQLTAHNGYVLRAGQEIYITHSTSYDRSVWLLKDGTGFYKIKTRAQGATIFKNTGQIVLRYDTSWELYTVNVTGKGTADPDPPVLDNSTAAPGYNDEILSQVVEYFSGKFAIIHEGSGYNENICMEIYDAINYNFEYFDKFYDGLASNRYVIGPLDYKGAVRNLLDAGEQGKLIALNGYIFRPPLGNPMVFGWNGSSWELNHSGSKQITESGIDALFDNVSVQFNNAIGQTWDTQFVDTERFTFMYAASMIKDNLQKFSAEMRTYFSEIVNITGWSTNVPAGSPYTITIPEASSDVNFRDLDSHYLAMKVTQGGTEYTMQENETTWVDSNIYSTVPVPSSFGHQDGDIISFTTNNGYRYLARNLMPNRIYYAIRKSDTELQIAKTYADAIAHNNLIFSSWHIEAYVTRYVSPDATEKFNAKPDGTIEFHSSDAGKAVSIDYTYTRLA